ncbi:hypothetical protein LCGC14_2637120, partial [marine sediment metagenome]
MWHHPYDNFQLVLRDEGLYGISGPWTDSASKKFDPLTGRILSEFNIGRRARRGSLNREKQRDGGDPVQEGRRDSPVSLFWAGSPHSKKGGIGMKKKLAPLEKKRAKPCKYGVNKLTGKCLKHPRG